MARKTRQPKTENKKIVADDARDEANKKRFGTDTGGIVAQDLPEAAHGQNVVDSPRQMRRNLPHQHGGMIGEHEEGGTRGDRNLSDADDHGGRKRN